jgi:SAM-dependent methyltransferase
MSSVNIGDLPVFLKFNTNKFQQISDAPEKLPMYLKEDLISGLISMTSTKDLDRLLEGAYLLGSEPSGYMAESGIGVEYANNFVSYIERTLRRSVNSLKILEIGCGSGHLLNLLAEKGAICVGIEPNSRIRSNNSAKFRIINGFFPKDLESEHSEFDVIIMFAVLEHFPNPKEIVSQILTRLKSEGEVIVAVPDCLPYLETGDPSFLFHEHYQYFTAITLKNLFASEGFSTEVSQSSYGGSLYATARKSPHILKAEPPRSEQKVLDLFVIKLNKNVKEFECYLNKLADIGYSRIGIWVPSRAINILTLSKINKKLKLEFYDDNENIIGKFLPTFDIPIKNFNEFKENPPDIVIIMSFSFGQIIKKKLENVNLCKIVLFEELIRFGGFEEL